MAESSSNRKKTPWKTEKSLLFLFFPEAFSKEFYLRLVKNQGLFWKGLNFSNIVGKRRVLFYTWHEFIHLYRRLEKLYCGSDL